MLTEQQIENNKNEFINALTPFFSKRPGLDKLVDWLKSSDFFISPSSSCYHGNFKGGLCDHSLNVYHAALKFRDVYNELVEQKNKPHAEITDEEIAIAALLHDLCKCNNYKEVQKWKKDANNQWQSYVGYDIDDKFPYGHGDKSCFIIQRFMCLTWSEALAIRFHMGQTPAMFLDPDYKYAYGRAINECPLVTIIHEADSFAAFTLEEKEEH